MVRLVFRPYTQVGRPICTSGPLRASTRVSSGFALPRHSSPSFGYHRTRSSSTSPTERARRAGGAPPAGAGGSHPGETPVSHLHCAAGARGPPSDSRARWTPWSVFQDGSGGRPASPRTSGAQNVGRIPRLGGAARPGKRTGNSPPRSGARRGQGAPSPRLPMRGRGEGAEDTRPRPRGASGEVRA